MTVAFTPFTRALYAYAFFFDFMLAYAIYAAWFELNGLSYVQIGALLAFWSASALVLELFTGALSDRLDRRWLLIAAPLLKVFTFVAWAFADGNVWMYGVGFAMWSMAGALYSGTAEALLFERAEEAGLSPEFDRYYGRMSAAKSLGVGAGLLFGGLVAARFGMGAALWLSIPPLLAGAISAVWLQDTRRARGHTPEPYWQNFRIAFIEFRTLPNLRFVTLYIAIGLIAFEELEEFDQLYYTAVNLPLWLFGVAGVVGMIAHAIAGVTAHRLAHRPAIAWLLPGLAGGLFILSAFATNAWFVIVLEAAYIIAIPPIILAHARFQQVIEGRARATTTSVMEVFQNITALLLALAFGWLATQTGILPAYGWAGVGLLFVATWVWWATRRGMTAI